MKRSRTTITMAVVAALAMVALVLTSAAAMNPKHSKSSLQACAPVVMTVEADRSACL